MVQVLRCQGKSLLLVLHLQQRFTCMYTIVVPVLLTLYLVKISSSCRYVFCNLLGCDLGVPVTIEPLGHPEF